MDVKLSLKAYAIEKRLRRLPKYFANYLEAMTKKDAVGTIKAFRDGIKNDELGLDKLNDKTVMRKTKLGYSRPDAPLYGKGGRDLRTFYNMLIVQPIKDGYKVVPSKKKHYKSDITLDHLFNIHEYGCIIMVTPRMRAFLHYIGIHLKKDTGYIRIPARRPLYKAYVKYLKSISKKDRSQKVKRMITKYINDGDTTYIQADLEKVRAETERDMI